MSDTQSKDSLDKLGKILINCFKDLPLGYLEDLLDGKLQVKDLLGLQNKIGKLDEATKDLIRACASETLIQGLGFFLGTIYEYFNSDDAELKIVIDGESVVKLTPDNLSGLLFSRFGWDANFSKFPTLDEIHEKYNV